MKVFRRPLYAWLALLGIVFSQLAVSAYACPFWGDPSPQHESSVVMDEGDMAGMHCAEMGNTDAGTTPTALCVQHCDQGNQTVGSAHTLDFHPTLVLLPFVAPMSQFQAASESFDLAPLLVSSSSPPPLWRTGRLRI